VARVRIDLAYDGAPFRGFARQPDHPTVQGTLEGALARVLGVDVVTTCAGRTDAGVHALAQVVHLDVDPDQPRTGRWLDLLANHPASVARRLDRMVGDAITIWRVAVVDDDFDARFSATERRYRYRLVDDDVADPRLRGVRWTVGERLDVAAMHAAAQHLVGEQDFASLCRRAPGGHTRRRVDEAVVERVDEEVHVRLRGPAFCHQQVRSSVGCLVEVGAGRRSPGWLGEVVAARDRSLAARVAPPQGLTLEAVVYGDGWPPAPPDR
jgi:tRNA pseudouridine38-40 synthase